MSRLSIIFGSFFFFWIVIHNGNVKTYFQMIFVTIVVIFILASLCMKLFLFIGFVFILKMWLEVSMKTNLGKQYLIMLKIDEEIRYGLKAKAVNQSVLATWSYCNRAFISYYFSY